MIVRRWRWRCSCDCVGCVCAAGTVGGAVLLSAVLSTGRTDGPRVPDCHSVPTRTSLDLDSFSFSPQRPRSFLIMHRSSRILPPGNSRKRRTFRLTATIWTISSRPVPPRSQVRASRSPLLCVWDCPLTPSPHSTNVVPTGMSPTLGAL